LIDIATEQEGTYLATRAVIVKPEKRRCAQSLSLIAAVLPVCNIAQINK